MKTRFNISESKKFAIFVRSAYGDLIMTIPLIKVIKAINPNCFIKIFAESKNSEIIPFIPHVDEYEIIPSKGNKYLSFIKYGFKNRAAKFDYCFSAKTGTGSANGFFPFCLGAKNRVSYVPLKLRWTDYLINRKILFNEKMHYESQHYALGVLGLLIERPTMSHLHNFKPTLNIKSKLGGSYKILTSVSNNRSSCQLKNSTLAKILNSLAEKYKFEIIVSYIEKDKELALDLKKRLRPKVSLKSTPKIKQLLELISSVNLLFIGEGGIMHMAAAMEKPQLVLFGITSEVTWGPLSNSSTVIKDEKDVNSIPSDVIVSKLVKIVGKSLKHKHG